MTSVIGSKIQTRRAWQGVHVTCIPSLVGVAFQVSEISFLFVDLQIYLKSPLPKNKMGSKNLCKVKCVASPILETLLPFKTGSKNSGK